jgi:hypothetical protein
VQVTTSIQGALMSVLLAAAALSSVTSAQAGEPAPLSVQLNKLETYDKGCRAYVVINNATDVGYQAVKLDLVLFQPDGVIARRFAIDLAPFRAAKKTVKLFDIEGLACDKISSVLVNEALECRGDAGPVADCLAKLSFSSVAGPQLTTK